MNSQSKKANQELYDEDLTEDDLCTNNEDSDSYAENETPNYVSITDTIPVVDFHQNPNEISTKEKTKDDSENSENSNIDNYIPLTQPISQDSSTMSIPYKNSNCNTDSTDNISTTAVNDNHSSNSAFDGYSSRDGYENKVNNGIFGILDLKPDSISVPPFFNEPSTVEAMKRLGFVQSDLVPPDYNQIPGNDEIRSKIIIELEKRRIQMIEEVINERNKIVKNSAQKEANSTTIPKNLIIKGKSKKKQKRKAKKGKRRRKKKVQNHNEEDDELSEENHEVDFRPKRKAVKKAKKEEINPNILTASRPIIHRKKPVKNKPSPNEIRRKKIEETIQQNQKKVELEIAKKIEESEKRIKMQQELKNKEANEIKQKRLQRKKEIEMMKKENELKKQRAAQKALQKMDQVEMRQAQIRQMKMDEIRKKNELREKRLQKAKNELKKKQDEQMKKLNMSLLKAERNSRAKKTSPKIIVPQVPPK